MNDYISDPNITDKEAFLRGYILKFYYRWEYASTGKSGIRQIRVKSLEYARELIGHWNNINKEWLYREAYAFDKQADRINGES